MFFAASKLGTAKPLPAVNGTVMTAFETFANASGTVVCRATCKVAGRQGFAHHPGEQREPGGDGRRGDQPRASAASKVAGRQGFEPR